MTEDERKTILVTGASGLLGREIVNKLQKGFNVVGVCLNRWEKYNLRKLDLTEFQDVEEFIDGRRIDFIIHSAAQRAPDRVEKDYAAAVRLNVNATLNLARIAAIKSIPMLYISTDYVFDGNDPPYKETDKPNPINKYGSTKLDGEKVTMDASSDNLVLRVPVLYGLVESMGESAVTCLLQTLLDEKATNVSDHEIRWPAHTGDVAAICLGLVERRLTDPSVSGIYQWSGKEGMTKYEMIQTMAEQFSLKADHVIPDKKVDGGAPRPYDCQLDTGRLERLGIGRHTVFKDGVRECLKKFVTQ